MGPPITSADAVSCALIAPDYEVDQDELLLFRHRSATKSEHRVEPVWSMIPEFMQHNLLHYYHISFVDATKVLLELISRSRQSFTDEVHTLSECATKCDRRCGLSNRQMTPCDRSGTPNHVQTAYIFQILAIDYIPSLPRSFKVKTELLI